MIVGPTSWSCCTERGQLVQAVDIFAHLSELELLGPVALFHPAVVFEKRDIVAGAFDARHDAKLVIELDAGCPHLVADTGTLDAGVEIIADLALIITREFATEEGGHLVGFDGVDDVADDGVIQGLKLGLAEKIWTRPV